MRYMNLAKQYIQKIESGQLSLHSKMPSLRKFKQLHNVSMTTALNCYQHLESLGWLISKPQSGYYVAQLTTLNMKLNEPILVSFESSTTQPQEPKVSYSTIENSAFGFARYDPILIPINKLQLSFKRAIKQQGNNLTNYPTPNGELLLRKNLSNHFKRMNFHFSASECVITHGCLDAIRTCIEITTQQGDAVAISSPCFSGLLELLGSMKRRVVEIPSVNQGIDLEQLEKQMQLGNIKAGLFCTSYMNPQGISMSAIQKQKLVELATIYKVPIIEDDVYLELGYQGVTPLPAKHWDIEGYILWCGSISKTIAPSYRLGWCVPGRYMELYIQQRLLTNQGVNTPIQLAIADFIQCGNYLKHLRIVRLHLQQQNMLFTNYLQKKLPAHSKISQPRGGYVLWIQVMNLDTQKLKKNALAHQLDIYIGEMFSTLDLYPHYFRLNIAFTFTPQLELQLDTLIHLIDVCIKE